METEIEKLVVKIDGDSTSLDKALDKSETKIKKFVSSTEESLEDFTKRMDGMLEKINSKPLVPPVSPTASAGIAELTIGMTALALAAGVVGTAIKGAADSLDVFGERAAKNAAIQSKILAERLQESGKAGKHGQRVELEQSGDSLDKQELLQKRLETAEKEARAARSRANAKTRSREAEENDPQASYRRAVQSTIGLDEEGYLQGEEVRRYAEKKQEEKEANEVALRLEANLNDVRAQYDNERLARRKRFEKEDEAAAERAIKHEEELQQKKELKRIENRDKLIEQSEKAAIKAEEDENRRRLQKDIEFVNKRNHAIEQGMSNQEKREKAIREVRELQKGRDGVNGLTEQQAAKAIAAINKQYGSHGVHKSTASSHDSGALFGSASRLAQLDELKRGKGDADNPVNKSNEILERMERGQRELAIVLAEADKKKSQLRLVGAGI